MSVKAVVFDCGGVVLRDSDLERYRRWERRLGLETDTLKARLYQGPIWSDAELGKITEAAFWSATGEVLGLTEQEAQALGEDAWASWSVDPEVLELIKRLCQRYRVAMLSNATDILEQRLRDNYAVNQYFDPIINSAVIGIAKPDPAIYRHLLDRLALEAGQVLFIDDKAENIAAAAALGMHVIWYVSSAELERQLTPYLGLDVSSSTTD